MLKAADSNRMESSLVVETSIFFMKGNPLHDRQKPYAYRYAAETDIQQNNFELQEYDHITMEDIRGHLHDFSV